MTINRAASRIDIAAWVIAGGLLLLVLLLHLLPALLAGLLVYELVHMIAPLTQRRLSSQRSRIFAVALLATLIIGIISAAIVAAAAFLRGGTESLPALLQKMAEIIEGTRSMLPLSVTASLPADGEALRDALAHWLRAHSPQVELAGREAVRVFAHILVGMVIGAMVSLREVALSPSTAPLSRALIERADRLGNSFRRIVFAQVRIAALNTIFTAIYLAVLLPLAGIHLPLTKTLIAVTFVAGLLPVVGNLISNTIIVIVSLAQSPQVALASLAFLILIHKTEYFLNARIVGSRIHARAWEILVAMLLMEAAFGLAGVVAAPIYYAYLKNELAERRLV